MGRSDLTLVTALGCACVVNGCLPDPPGLGEWWEDPAGDNPQDDIWSDIETPPEGDEATPPPGDDDDDDDDNDDNDDDDDDDDDNDDDDDDDDPQSESDPGTSGGSDTGTGSGDTDDPPRGDLRITELVPDPEGADGGPDGPEFVELVNAGEAALGLDAFELLVRSWPQLDAEDLSLVGTSLEPSQVLVIRRFAKGTPIPDGPELVGDAIFVSFTTGSGMKNGDGAVLARAQPEQISDLVVYGAAQGPPFDDPDAWAGGPAPTPGTDQSLCRVDAFIDEDTASDWELCPPSPGTLPVDDDDPSDDPETSGDTSDDGTSGTDGDDVEPDTGDDDDDDATGDDQTGETGDSSDTGNSGDTSHPDDTSDDDPDDAIPLTGDVVIMEVLSNAPGPSGDERDYEYVELLNAGDEPVNLEGWLIADDPAEGAKGTDPLLFRSGDGGCDPQLCLAPGELALVVGSVYIGQVGDALVLEVDDTTLADGGLTSAEPVVIRDSSGEIVSTYRLWSDPTADPYPISTELPLLRSDPAAEDAPENWAFSEETPGTRRGAPAR